MEEHDLVEARDRGKRNEWRLDALDLWRVATVDPAVARMNEFMTTMTVRHRLTLSFRQAVLAVVLAVGSPVAAAVLVKALA